MLENDLEIVIPVYNEEKNLSPLVTSIQKAFHGQRMGIGLILVDDYSRDNTWKEILRLKSILQLEQNGDLKVDIRAVRFRKNLGQFKAIECGLKLSKASYVVVMDGDLQHPPSVAREMWDSRFDAETIAARQIRRKDNISKAFLSNLFYFVIRIISGLQIPRNVSDFRIINRESVDLLLQSHDELKMIRFLVHQIQIQQKIIDYEPAERGFGTNSNYSIKSMMHLAGHSVLMTSKRLLKLGLGISFAYFFFILLFGFYAIFLFLTGDYSPAVLFLTTIMLISFFLTFLILGILSVYLIQLLPKSPRKLESHIGDTI